MAMFCTFINLPIIPYVDETGVNHVVIVALESEGEYNLWDSISCVYCVDVYCYDVILGFLALSRLT